MINGRRISVVLPAYNAEVTLSRTVAELDQDVIDEIVLVDDASTDQTVSLARELGLEPILHDVNLGYGANQKTCYRQAIDSGADIVVIGTPMYNFTIPTQLKAWLDRIIIAGKTFRYTETGPIGLAAGKKVIIASSRGGLYAPGMPFAANDFQEPYLRAILGFIGITDIEVVRAEGIAYGPEHREAAMRAALASVPSVVAGLVPAKAA